MEKEFEALERLKTAPSFMGGTEKYRFSTNSVSTLLEDYELVKQALAELKAIKEANPSEAMECVDDLIFNFTVDEYVDRYDKNLVTIKNYIFNTQELEKENQELLQVVALFKQKLEDTNDIKIATTMMKQLDTNISLEKENAEYKEVLEIIKEKDVDMYSLRRCEKVGDYNTRFTIDEYQKLTEEEFNILKRWNEK